jgi:diguanylate cyclase (GGDEF)-like protein
MVWRWSLVVASWLAYLVSFPLAFEVLHSSATLLALVPITCCALFWERRGGVSAAVIATFIGLGQLYYALNESVAMWLTELTRHPFDLIVYLLTGLAVGWVALLRRELRMYKRASNEARYDPLTGLLNRASFVANLNDIIMFSRQQQGQAGVLFVDLDKFKYVNDTYGHDIGDELLKQVGRILKASVRQGDIVARLGGDEFMLVLTGLQEASSAAAIADKIVKALSTPFKLQGKDIRIGASVGISIYPADGETADDLIKAADTAMYNVKAAGRNSYTLKTSEVKAKESKRQELEKQLQLGFDNHEFEMYFQAQVNLSSKKLSGLEDLLRWRSPSLGIVAPAEFLSIAESAGLLLPLDHWALREVCHQLVSWQNAGFTPVKVAVNISALQFAQPDFIEHVEAALWDFGLNARWLEFELSEAALSLDPSNTPTKIKKLHDLGIGLSLDNFGLGHSSLVALHKLPIGTLKVDKSLIQQLAGNLGEATSAQLIEAICAFGQKLGKRLMAEGVETALQHKAIVQMGFETGQGYYYAKPVSVAEVLRFLKKGKPQEDETNKLLAKDG